MIKITSSFIPKGEYHLIDCLKTYGFYAVYAKKSDKETFLLAVDTVKVLYGESSVSKQLSKTIERRRKYMTLLDGTRIMASLCEIYILGCFYEVLILVGEDKPWEATETVIKVK